jgi:hypothetical protein
MGKIMWTGAGILVSAVCLVVAGCATGKAKISTVAPRSAMESYRTVAITVINDTGPICPEDVPSAIQSAAVRQMRVKYPEVFTDVEQSPKGSEGELLVEVHITKYKKGSRLARAMLIGLGSSKISTALIFLDSPTKRPLASGQLSLTWALGGIVGASKGIEDLVDDAGRKIANAIVEQKRGKSDQK